MGVEVGEGIETLSSICVIHIMQGLLCMTALPTHRTRARSARANFMVLMSMTVNN